MVERTYLKLSMNVGPDAERHISCLLRTPLIPGCSQSPVPYHTARKRQAPDPRANKCSLHAASSSIFASLPSPLVHGDAQLPQLPLGDLDLAHELVVGLGDVVEGQDAPAEADEQVGAEGDEGPEGQDGDDLGLDDGGEGDQVEVEGEVGLCLLPWSAIFVSVLALVVGAGSCLGGTYRAHEEGDGDGLLGARHLARWVCGGFNGRDYWSIG